VVVTDDEDIPPAFAVAFFNTAAKSAADLKIAGDPGAGAEGGGVAAGRVWAIAEAVDVTMTTAVATSERIEVSRQ
jgi:hypothetical protein